MSERDDALWQTKLAAWTHDPAEKALVLLRDPSGHERGTVKALRERLFPDRIPAEIEELVKRADHWAAAADRPQFPKDSSDRYPNWAQVRFWEDGVLIHPLSGKVARLRGLAGDIPLADIKSVSLDHFAGRIVEADGTPDLERTFLAFWRFGPESPHKDLAALWRLLPADTRVPDHTIWGHLDLASAFAGALAADPARRPALLRVSFGPVQGFIAQARTTSDLWAGSHLLSAIAWEGIKAICERLGPDCVTYPQLRGVAQVDLWLREKLGAAASDWFRDEPWCESTSDANPLFAAALPNVFVAIVPEAAAEKLARHVSERVCAWVKEQGGSVLKRLLKKTEQDADSDLACHNQLAEQLADFPEVHWSVAAWPPATQGDDLGVQPLQAALGAFYPPDCTPGFFETEAWKVLSQRQGDFYAPNPGLLYDPVYDLADRTLRATKAHRPFVDLHQEGLRCSVCGEREWLTLDREQFRWTRNQRLENEKHGHGTLWTKVAKADARWASEGEHLCAHCALKRLWPDLVLDEVEGIVGKEARRFVISTRTMAFAPDLEEIAQFDEKKREKLEASPLWDRVRTHGERAALPRRIAGLLRDKGEVESFVRRLPAHLDDLRDRAESDDPETQRKGEEKLDKAESELRGLLGHAPETYYALLLMDGDRMGAWLTGGSSESIGEPLRKLDEKNTWPEDTGSGYNLPVGGSWHERVRDHVWRQFPDLRRYMLTERGASPSRHIAISEALNSFALGLARPAVDELHKGWLIYAGGDDLMAMVSVDDLLPLMTTLRSLYSGILPAGDGDPLWRDLTRPWRAKDVPKLGDGYVLFRKRLHRVMGPQATASIGAVVAHNRVPLGRVIRALRETERRAKGEGGRNAFAIRVMKRAGGEVSLVAPWYFGGQDPTALALADTPMGVLIRLRDFLAREGVSRRAAYHTFEWLRQLPRKDEVRAGYRRLVEDNLRYQLRRQAEKEEAKNEAAEVAAALTSVTFESAEDRARRGVRAQRGGEPVAEAIEAFLATAEFLARRSRAPRAKPDVGAATEAAE